ELALQYPFVGAEHLVLVLLERGRDEALAAGNRLLTEVVARDVRQVRFRNLDVVPEDAVVADFQRVDPGAAPLRLLHLGDAALAGAADVPELVELGIDTVANRAAVAGERRRLVQERRFEIAAQICQIVETSSQASDERRAEPVEQQADPRNRRQRLTQRDQIAGTRGAERGAGHQPLHVVHRPERVLDFRALGGAERELFDRIEAILDALERQQRLQQPGPEQTPPHRRDRAVDLVEQRSGAAAIRRLDDVEVLERGRVDDETVGAGAERDLADVREVGLLRLTEILHERARGADRGRMPFETESRQALSLQLLDQCAARGFGVERPRLDRRDHGRQPQRFNHRGRLAETGRRNDLARTEHGNLV